MLRRQRYLDKQERRRNAMLAAGLVADRFPGVASIAFRLTYYQKSSAPVLMTRTVNFFPASSACFHLDCMREECINGGFDLAPVVARLVKGQSTSAKGNLTCHGNDAILRHGHASLAYQVNIQYARKIK
jgi:hypothetical protein